MIKTGDSTKSKDEPRIVGFVCNWRAYSGLEMAGMYRIKYASNVRFIKLMCLGRLHSGLILKAFEFGADGVMLMGCPSGNCHYESGVDRAKETVAQTKKMLNLLGIESQRLTLVEVPLAEGAFVARQINSFAKRIGKLGRSPIKYIGQAKQTKVLQEEPSLI